MTGRRGRTGASAGTPGDHLPDAVLLSVCDLNGRLRSKRLGRDRFAAAAAGTCPFPPIFPVMDFDDRVYPVPAGAALGRLGDGAASPCRETLRQWPWQGVPSGWCLAEMTGPEAQLDPRVLYRRVLARAEAGGWVPRQSLEYEFTLLEPVARAGAGPGATGFAPAGSQSALYGTWRALAEGEFWSGLDQGLRTAGITVEAMHGEFGAGCHEVIVGATQGVRAGDDAVLMRELVRAHAARHGLLATFMARWSGAAPGHSGHVHISLCNREGRNLFGDRDAGGDELLRHFLGGLQRWLPESLLLLMPNVNSFRRLSPGAWSFDPRWCLWGEDNRTVPLRVIRNAAGAAHVEIRLPGADANPYLVLAVVLGAGLAGVSGGMEPSAPIMGSAFESSRQWPEALRLPRSFLEAIDRCEGSAFVADLLGEEFRRVFTATRRAQELESRDAVSEWELRRFLA